MPVMSPNPLTEWLQGMRRPKSTVPPPDDYMSPRRVAQRFRSICREAGPDAVLAAVGAKPEVDADNHRHVAYLLAHSLILPEAAIELCIEQGILGFEESVHRR